MPLESWLTLKFLRGTHCFHVQFVVNDVTILQYASMTNELTPS